MKSDCTAFHLKQHEHQAVDAQIQDYLSRGGTIETVPRGVSALNGISSDLSRHNQKRQKQLQTKLTEDTEE